MNVIAAVDENRGIGLNNSLLFSIPEDRKFFKEKTIGKTVVMGRETLESLPCGLPLAGRRNIVLTRNTGFSVAGAIICHDIAELKESLSGYPDDEIYIIGGESVYNQLLDYCSRAFITKVHAVRKADRFFPNLDLMDNWHIVSESKNFVHEGIKFSFVEYFNSDRIT